MVVRTNVLALNAHRNLGMTGLQQSRASSRLSSGFRINSAADDAAGLGISEKMRAQIRGLDQAARNAQDGISLIQTAEGAMGTINDMVKRIRDLVVQAANDTNAHDMTNEATWSQSDRTRIQEEINQLMAEIDGTVLRTEFNTRTLLDGSLGAGAGPGAGAGAVTWNAGDAVDFKALLAMSNDPMLSSIQLSQNLFRFINPDISAGESASSSRDGNTFKLESDDVKDVLRVVLGDQFERNFKVDDDTFANALSAKVNNALAALVGNTNPNTLNADVTRWLADQGVYNAEPGSEVQTFAHLFSTPAHPDNRAMYAAHNAVFEALAKIDLTQLVTRKPDADESLKPLFEFNLNGNNIMLSNPGNITDIVGATNAARAALSQFITDKMGTEIDNTGIGALTEDFVQWLVANGTAGFNAAAGVALLGLFYTTNQTVGGRGVLTEADWINSLDDFMKAERFFAGWQTVSIDNDTGILDVGENAQIVGGGQTVQLVTAEGQDAADMVRAAGLSPHLIEKEGVVVQTRTFMIEHSSSAGGTREITLELFVSVAGDDEDGTNAVLEWRFKHDNALGTINAGRDEIATISGSAGLSEAGMAFRDGMIAAVNDAIRPFVQDGGPGAVEGGGGLWFQVGANAGQGVILNIEAVDVEALSAVGASAVESGFTFADLRTPDASFASRGQGVLKADGEEISKFITAIDFALSHATAQRSSLGAMQNRLEFTIENLNISSENLSAAESRIRDADMAMEMMRFTQSNILQQAAISMLAQANQAPNMILSLLR